VQKNDVENRLKEFNAMLLSRDYNKKMVKNSVLSVKYLDRTAHLTKVTKTQTKGLF
jgi:hypothetical protein